MKRCIAGRSILRFGCWRAHWIHDQYSENEGATSATAAAGVPNCQFSAWNQKPQSLRRELRHLEKLCAVTTCDNSGFRFRCFRYIVTVHRPAVLCWFTLEVPLPYERALPAQGNLGVDISSQLVELAWFWWSCPYVMWVSLGVTCIFLILYLFFLYLCPASCIFLCFISASWFLEISLDGDLYLRLLLDYTFIYYITFID